VVHGRWAFGVTLDWLAVILLWCQSLLLKPGPGPQGEKSRVSRMGLFGKSSFALPLAMREVPGKCGRGELLETPVHKDGRVQVKR
jgi:hypothetical protein